MSTNVDDITSKSAAFTFKMKLSMKFTKCVQCIWSKMNHFMGDFGAIAIDHVSKKELPSIYKYFKCIYKSRQPS